MLIPPSPVSATTGRPWPASVAPYAYHLLVAGSEAAATEAAERVYVALGEEQTLYDDREFSALWAGPERVVLVVTAGESGEALAKLPSGSYRILASAGAGGAVRLTPAAETLLIGEGIETCLAAMQATAQPAWAALSTSGMKTLSLPPIVRTVIILADHDCSGAGERAARIAETYWRREGRRVSVWMSPCPGEDANDRLLAALSTQRPNVAA